MTKSPVHIRQLKEGGGVPVVLLHGFLGSSSDFEPMVQADEFPDRAVLAADLPGHAEAGDFSAEWSFHEVTEALLSELPERFDLVGYSMGGRIALHLTGTNPERVRKLALIGAHPGLEHPQDRADRAKLDSARASLLVEVTQTFLDEWRQQELFGPSTSKAWEAVHERRRREAEDHGFGWSRALVSLSLGRQVMLWNIPYLTETPTLFVVGTHDEKFLELGREFVAQNPDVAQIALIVNAHHAPHLDRPAAVAKRLASFW